MAFTDMMSSSRGPGLIGFLIALLVLVGFGFLMMLSSDEEGVRGSAPVGREIKRQHRDIDSLKSTLHEMQQVLSTLPDLEALHENFEAVQREKSTAEAVAASLKDQMAATNSEIKELARETEAYQDEYRALVRGRAKGMALSHLETRDGTIYQNVTIRNVNAVGMQISHADGVKQIAFELLPDEIQEQFQFDPDQKARAMSEEEERRKAYEAGVDSALHAADEMAESERKKHAEKVRADTMAAIRLKESWISSGEQEVRSLRRAIARQSTRGISRAPQLKAELNQKLQKLAVIKADVARLKATL